MTSKSFGGNVDWIEAGEGRDNIVAGPGNDYIEGGFDGRKDDLWGGDLIDAGAGDDTVFGDYHMTLAQAVSGSAPAEFGAFIVTEIARWTADAKAAGIEAK